FPDMEANKQPCEGNAVSHLVISPLKDEETEKETIIKALKACNGHREQAARLLRINPSTLYRKMNKYGLK
ncbi:helix-turn-helix domain-containing protein, partial [Xylanibacter rodentium]